MHVAGSVFKKTQFELKKLLTVRSPQNWKPWPVLLTFDHVADVRFRLVENIAASLAFEHLNRYRTEFGK